MTCIVYHLITEDLPIKQFSAAETKSPALTFLLLASIAQTHIKRFYGRERKTFNHFV